MKMRSFHFHQIHFRCFNNNFNSQCMNESEETLNETILYLLNEALLYLKEKNFCEIKFCGTYFCDSVKIFVSRVQFLNVFSENVEFFVKQKA